jgi:hypothetical protein
MYLTLYTYHDIDLAMCLFHYIELALYPYHDIDLTMCPVHDIDLTPYPCSRRSRRGLVQEDKRMAFVYTHGLFIT